MKAFLKEKFRKNLPYSLSLFLVFSAVLLLTMISVASFFVFRYHKDNSLLTSEYNSTVISRLTSEIDSFFQAVEDLSAYPYIYKEWSEQMTTRVHYPLGIIDVINMINIKDFDSSLAQMANSKVENDGVFLFCENGQLLYSSSQLPNKVISGYHNNFAYKESEWYKEIVAKDGSAVLFHPEQVDRTHMDCVFLARLVKDTTTRKEIGVYMISIKKSGLDKICRPYIEQQDEQCVIFDKNGTILYSLGKELELPDDFFIGDEKQAEMICMINDAKYLVTSGSSTKFGLKIARFVPLSVSEEARRVTVLTIILFVVFTTLFGISIFFVLSKSLTKPIQQLRDGMQQVEEGNYSVELTTNSGNEFFELFGSFNSMTAKIKYLLEKVLAEEILKKEAQIIALQRQINPHFLYNTLDSIQIVAISSHDYQTSRMITSLAKLLRYSISDNENVLLRDELNAISDYVFLMQIRYKNSFELIQNVQDDFLEMPIMRFTLQPIIENSIQHGLRGAQGGKIEIMASNTPTGYEICIRDNGKGIEIEKLMEIQHRLYDNALSHSSVGIYNVNSRLKTIYGKESGLRIESCINVGTEVIIHLASGGK